MVKKTRGADQGQESNAGENSNFFKSLIASCPYIFAGRKAFGYIRNGPAKAKSVPDTDRERDIRTRIKIGKAIALVGFFCPLFWITLFSGNRGPELYFNAAHSGVVILVGLGYMVKCRAELERERAQKSMQARKGGAVQDRE